MIRVLLVAYQNELPLYIDISVLFRIKCIFTMYINKKLIIKIHILQLKYNIRTIKKWQIKETYETSIVGCIPNANLDYIPIIFILLYYFVTKSLNQ